MFGQKFFNYFNVLMIKNGHLSFWPTGIYLFERALGNTHSRTPPGQKDKSLISRNNPLIFRSHLSTVSFLQ